METRRVIRAIVALPGMVTLVIPALILHFTEERGIGWGLPGPYSVIPPLAALGLLALGLTLMVLTIRLFAQVGQGTLAPWDPTRRLVARGIYRYVRNPMISGVFCVLLGEAILMGSLPLLSWALLFLAVNATYIPLVEERGLLHRFGNDYAAYKKNVPRWIPRRTPWEQSGEDL